MRRIWAFESTAYSFDGQALKTRRRGSFGLSLSSVIMTLREPSDHLPFPISLLHTFLLASSSTVASLFRHLLPCQLAYRPYCQSHLLFSTPAFSYIPPFLFLLFSPCYFIQSNFTWRTHHLYTANIHHRLRRPVLMSRSGAIVRCPRYFSTRQPSLLGALEHCNDHGDREKLRNT